MKSWKKKVILAKLLLVFTLVLVPVDTSLQVSSLSMTMKEGGGERVKDILIIGAQNIDNAYKSTDGLSIIINKNSFKDAPGPLVESAHYFGRVFSIFLKLFIVQETNLKTGQTIASMRSTTSGEQDEENS